MSDAADKNPEDAPSRARRLPAEFIRRIDAVAAHERSSFAALLLELAGPGLVVRETAMFHTQAARLGFTLTPAGLP